MNDSFESIMTGLFILSVFLVPAPIAVWLGWVWGGSRNNLKILFLLVSVKALIVAVFSPVWRYLFYP